MANKRGETISTMELLKEIEKVLIAGAGEEIMILSIMLRLMENEIYASVQEICDCLGMIKNQNSNKIMLSGSIRA